MNRLGNLNSVISCSHIQLRGVLEQSANELGQTMVLDLIQQDQLTAHKTIKARIKVAQKQYQDMFTGSLVKAKAIYYKKAEQAEKEFQENGHASSKTMKLGKEVLLSEHAYRMAILNLENYRQDFTKVRTESIKV